MPGGEDRLRAELERIAKSADPEGAFKAVAAKKARRRMIHKAQVVGLVVTVVAGTAAGSYGLAQVFRASKGLSPAASLPANGRIAFVTQGPGDVPGAQSHNVFTMNPDGSDLRALTHGAWQESQPTWSPDGTRLAFRETKFVIDPTSGTLIPEPYQLFVVNADGSDRRVLMKDPSGDGPGAPAWSPDGTRIAFASERDEPNPGRCRQCNSDIYVVNVDGTGLERLTHDPTAESSPDWSPDGKRIAFVKGQDHWVTIVSYGESPATASTTSMPRTFVVNADGSGAHPLLACSRSPCPDGLSPKWSPDGRSIAYFYPRADGRPGILISDPTGGNHRFVPTCSGGRCVAPIAGDWSPDGTMFLFEASDTRSPGPKLFTMRTDGSDLKQVGPSFAVDPSWQPLPAGVAQTPIPTVTPSPASTPTVTTSTPPSPAPSFSPSPSPTGDAPSVGHACGSTQVIADFDGDGTLDTLVVYPSDATLFPVSTVFPCPPPLVPDQRPFSIAIGWGSGGSETYAFTECAQGCAAYAAQDLDGNGTAEVGLIVDGGASTQFIDLYEIPNDHLGPILYEVGPPGTDKYKGFDPLKLAFGGSVTHQDFVTCQTGQNSGPQLIATSAQLSSDQTTWNLSETVFDYNGQVFPNDVPPRSAKAFTVASTRDYTEPFDPSGNPPAVTGDPCFPPA
jgi:Tol biopolymer transport system component